MLWARTSTREQVLGGKKICANSMLAMKMKEKSVETVRRSTQGTFGNLTYNTCAVSKPVGMPSTTFAIQSARELTSRLYS
jgi:hypothetical protein